MYKLNDETGEYDFVAVDKDQRAQFLELGYLLEKPSSEVEFVLEKPLTPKQKLAAEKEQLRRDALTQEERDAEDAAK